MIWIISVAVFLVGAATGALLFRALKSDAVKVKSLEAQLQALSEEHETYKSNVHLHFGNTAKLLNDMTDSYRKVYLHLASGAQSLCPDYISSQLSLSNDAKALLEREDGIQSNPAETAQEPPPAPPRDYAERMDAEDRKETLSEDYGIEPPAKD